MQTGKRFGLGGGDPLGGGLGQSGVSGDTWDLRGRCPAGLEMESRVCSKHIMDSHNDSKVALWDWWGYTGVTLLLGKGFLGGVSCIISGPMSSRVCKASMNLLLAAFWRRNAV